MRYRLTVRGDQLELRGYVDVDPPDLPYTAPSELAALAAALKPWGLVIASPAPDGFNPFVDPAP